MWILGFSGLYHDSAAAIIRDAEIIAAAQEERFSRKKFEADFPEQAIKFCLQQIPGIEKPDAIAYYESPVLAMDRVIKSSLQRAPRGGQMWVRAAKSMLANKADVGRRARQYVDADDKVFMAEHHMSHAASAFYPSPFENAAIVIADGVGEWATTTIALGKGREIFPLREIRYPHSLGLLYSAFTAYCGFKVNSGEQKLMGLAPYGEPRFKDVIFEHLIDVRDDGSFRLNLEFFGFMDSAWATNQAFHKLFGGPPLPYEGQLEVRHMDIAASMQNVINEVMTKLAREALRITGSDKLCLAGGVALNCVANGHLARNISGLRKTWIQPASGDAGGALGAALFVGHNHFEIPRNNIPGRVDGQKGSLLGPRFEDGRIERALNDAGLVYSSTETRDERHAIIAEALANGAVIGRFEGHMEYGPRALGNRSILADPRLVDAQSHINLRIKFRESWRPFAPAVLEHRAKEYFDLDSESPYMLVVVSILENLKIPVDLSAFRKGSGDLLEFVNQLRSGLPGITHVDYSARVQTVDAIRNPDFFDLLCAFEQKTGCPALINTSFNVRGEPIVCTPEDAVRCFLNTGMDGLLIGSFLVWKDQQSANAVNKDDKEGAHAPD